MTPEQTPVVTELLPCPFCACSFVCLNQEITLSGVKIVECGGCGARATEPLWNRRETKPLPDLQLCPFCGEYPAHDDEHAWCSEDHGYICMPISGWNTRALPPSPDGMAGKLAECLRECADDLEAEVNATYQEMEWYPSMMRKKEQDLQPVRTARELLAAYDAQTRETEKLR